MKTLKDGQDVTKLWYEQKLFKSEEFEESNAYSKALHDCCEAFINLVICEIKDPNLRFLMVSDMIERLEDLFISEYGIPIRYPTTVTHPSEGCATYYEHSVANLYNKMIGDWYKWNDEKKTAEINEDLLNEFLAHKK